MSQAEDATEMDERQWEPSILTFCCNWCSYAGADGAGTARMQYPPNARVIRVMCTGRINPLFIVKGFLAGADMVMVLGCHFGDCHYLKGNYTCDMRMSYLKAYLQAIGINPERLVLGSDLRVGGDQVRRNDAQRRRKGKGARANRQRNWRVRARHTAEPLDTGDVGI